MECQDTLDVVSSVEPVPGCHWYVADALAGVSTSFSRFPESHIYSVALLQARLGWQSGVCSLTPSLVGSGKGCAGPQIGDGDGISVLSEICDFSEGEMRKRFAMRIKICARGPAKGRMFWRGHWDKWNLFLAEGQQKDERAHSEKLCPVHCPAKSTIYKF